MFKRSMLKLDNPIACKQSRKDSLIVIFGILRSPFDKKKMYIKNYLVLYISLFVMSYLVLTVLNWGCVDREAIGRIVQNFFDEENKSTGAETRRGGRVRVPEFLTIDLTSEQGASLSSTQIQENHVVMLAERSPMVAVDISARDLEASKKKKKYAVIAPKKSSSSQFSVDDEGSPMPC